MAETWNLTGLLDERELAALAQFEETSESCPLCGATPTFVQSNKQLAEEDRQRHCRVCHALFFLDGVVA
jgi:formate dehydrogenase maturation protein FdhE